jgi:hypothetical protein
MPNHIPVIVDGVTYNNVREAWREVSPEGLPEITVRKRLAMGWEPDIAFTLLPIPPQLRRLGVHYRGLRHAE